MAQIFSLKNSKFFSGLKKICAIVPSITTYDEELKWGIQGYLLCLLANRLMLQLEPFGCKRARASIT